jgi:L-Lysine epsilon oxidase N-terminal/L-lysine epsilon oxidase C-terminal domain
MLRNPQPHPISDDKAPHVPAPPCDCDKDPIEGLKKLFVEYAQGVALARGRDPATRPVFLRLHGVAYGTFEVAKDLRDDFRVGVFGQKREYPVWVRFSGDIQPESPDLKGTAGVAIKLFGVEGKKLLTPDDDAATHDFLLQNHDVFFTDTARDMCEFTCQSLNGKFNEYVEAHPVTGKVLNDMEKVVDSVLATTYWSGLPYRFGKECYVKYKLEPEITPPSSGETPDYGDPFYLRGDLRTRLKNGEARFRLFIQLRTDDEAMPLDRATVRWDEGLSQPVHVATLILPRQDLDARGQSTYGENLAFNPWHALPEHEPVGSIAAARKEVYQASANVRRNFNAIPLGEPVEPRPAEWHSGVPYPPGKDETIVCAKIHPAIGIARVGDSDDWFIGPQVIEPEPNARNSYRDRMGRLKRQAAIFRIYGFNAVGEVVRELTAGMAAMKWTVHVANRKAAWYQWQMALDIPEAATIRLPRRNADVKGADRAGLVIDGLEHSIWGTNAQGPEYMFRGKFLDTGVYLGELQTDEAGRLRFLGGQGKSDSPKGAPILPDGPNGFINADGWYDDICDGPVTAEVTIEGRQIPVEGAWVVTAPPDYAPGLKGVRTLYDLLFDLNVRHGWLPFPEKISFRHHVYPILQRLSRLQWVNKGFAAQFGAGGPNNFEDKDYIRKLASKPATGAFDTYGELRRQVFNSFRDPNGTDNDTLSWPWIYGDAMDVPVPANTPRQNASISPTQYSYLALWAAGRFEDDWAKDEKIPLKIEDVPVKDQPAMLDRAALEFCLADAFHPGCEVTWPFRHMTMFTKPFRIHRASTVTLADYGKELTPVKALAPNGPLYAQGPGDLTRWMGLPWQADTAFCQSGYSPDYDPYLPTFWPAHVPNQVLTKKNYDIVVDKSQERARRLAAFSARMRWNDPLTGSTAEQMVSMVRHFGLMGLVELLDGISGDLDFPEKLLVASFGPGVEVPDPPRMASLAAAAPGPAAPHAVSPQEILRQRAIQEAGWESEDKMENAPIPVHHPVRK